MCIHKKKWGHNVYLIYSRPSINKHNKKWLNVADITVALYAQVKRPVDNIETAFESYLMQQLLGGDPATSLSAVIFILVLTHA